MSVSILANGKTYPCPRELSRKLLPKSATSFGPDFTGSVLRTIEDRDAPGGAPWFNGAVVTQMGKPTHALVLSDDGMSAFPVFGK
jgi:hypothetical protein